MNRATVGILFALLARLLRRTDDRVNILPAPSALTRAAAIGLVGAVALGMVDVVRACTAFCAAGAGQVLVGNNEDWTNPRTRVWFVPAAADSYGRMYVGFDDLHPQGGMNQRGLWFDGFAAPTVQATGSAGLPHFPGNIIDEAMAKCSTVEEVISLFEQYHRGFLSNGILMFADASGDAVSIEADAMVRKTGRFFVQTNFHQSRSSRGTGDDRYRIASAMLEQAGGDISVDLFRRILAATHQKGGAPTLYSNVYDLRSRTMHLYYFHDFKRAVTFQLDEELRKGKRVLDIPSLFPSSASAERLAARRAAAVGSSGRVPTIVVLLLPVAMLLVVVLVWIRGERPVRLALAGVAGAGLLVAAVGIIMLRLPSQSTEEWTEFAIGPASGDWVSIQASMMRTTGITLKGAIAIAHDVPAVRVMGPAWLGQTRYSLTAIVPPDEADLLRPRLLEELRRRLQLQTHFEPRTFDVFVLSAGAAPRLEKAVREAPSSWVQQRDAQLQGASMARLAEALQNILGKPVIDETGLTGLYDLELEWGDDRPASLTTFLHERFGLELKPAARQMDALVVDHIRRDAALVMLGQVGRLTRRAPADVRQHIARLLTIH